MPALRTEEILYHSALVLSGRGATEEARGLLDRARGEVLRKADLIADDAMRERFLFGVPLNRAILGDGEVDR